MINVGIADNHINLGIVYYINNCYKLKKEQGLMIDFLNSYFKSDSYNFIEIPGDASLRKYYRIYSNNISYILMDASREISSMQPFIEITYLLKLQNQNPPQILKEDISSGFLLLEDLGTNIINKMINDDNQENIYKKIIDSLVEIHQFDKEFCINNCKFQFPPNFTDFLISELEVFVEYYLKMIKKIPVNNQTKTEFLSYFKRQLTNLPKLNDVLILGDFHVDNLVYLPSGKIGLLDYQDALIGSPIYDLVSLLQDARRFVNFDLANSLISYYSHNANLDVEDVKKHYHLLGLQRNIRILGIFARKAILQKNDSYLIKYSDILKRYINHSGSYINYHSEFWFNEEFL